MADENDLNINIGANATGVESGTRRAKSAVKGVTDEAKGLDAAFRRIKSAIDPTFAAQEKYNKTLADAKALLDAGIIKKKEYKQALDAAKAALDSETSAIMRNSAAGKAAAAEARAQKAQEAAEARATAQAAREAAREKAVAERQAAREAAAAAKQKAAEEKAAIREAAAAAKQAAREKAAAERQAQREAAAAAKEAAAQEVAAAREKAAAERAAAKEASEAQKQARREEKAAAREAAQVAAAAAQAKKAAEREAAQAAREAAKATADQAKAERQAAQAATELRASIDPAFASQQRYNDTMRKATALLMDNKLKQGEWVAIQRQAKAQMDINARSMGRMNTIGVQLGYQMQDVTASIASGINPLVILAQQGGQTAAAMSMMGGTIGRVAAFLAGPWGAAIIGFTLLLGYLWDSEDEGKKKTLDLNDAESRRAATVRDLTAALRDYVAQQRESNNQQLTNLTNTVNQNYTDTIRFTKEVEAAQKELNEAQEQYNSLKASAGADPGKLIALGVAYVRVTRAQKALTAAQNGLKVAQDATTESAVALANSQSTLTAEDRQHQKTLQTIVDTYRASTKQLSDYDAMVAAMRAENDRYTAAKEKEAEAHRENAKAARDEAKALFQSRQQAIQLAGHELQKQGFQVGENFAFGPVGQHPGMGREAHGKFAIDVNIPGAGSEAFDAVTKTRMDKMVAAYQARGFRVLWNGKVYNPFGQGASYDIPAGKNQHTNHVHIEAPQSIVGKPAGSKLANDLIADANRVETEQRRIAEEALKDQIADMEFRKELNRDDLQQVLAIQDEKIAAIKAFYGADSKEALDAEREKTRIQRQFQQEQIRIAQQTIQKKLDIAQQELEEETALMADRRAMESDTADFNQQNGLVGERAALAEKKRILGEEYQDQVNHEEAMYSLKASAIRDQLALENLTLDARRQLNDQLEVMEAEHQARMTGLKSNFARQSRQIDLQTASISLQTWRGMAQTVTQSLGSTFQGLWTRSMTVWQGLINLGDQIVYKFADMGLKVLEDFMVKQAVKLGLVHSAQAAETGAVAAGEAARTGVVASGEATRQGIGAAGVAAHGIQQAAKTGATVTSEAVQTGAKVTGEGTRQSVGAAGAISEITTRAATSAAGAFSSTVVIPFIGPVAAPVAAAAALAAVLGFAALISARGGQAEVPFDGQLSMLHKKEMVLPAWAAEPLRQQLRTGASSAPIFGAAAAAGASVRENNTTNGDVNFHYGPQYGGGHRPMDMDAMLKRDGDRLRRWIRKEVRNGTILGGSK